MDETNERLIKNAQQGDEHAFGLLVKHYYQRVFNVVLGIVRDQEDAKEITQQTWVKVWKKLDTFRGDAAFSTWLFRIATFTAIDFIRKKKRLAEVEYLEEIDASDASGFVVQSSKNKNLESELHSQELKAVFREALHTLSENHRTALTLREIEGLSYEEIAKIMECKIGTVMSRIYNARKLIQKKMKGLL